ncbi:MerR family DNA-binding transcriptional regulator [Caulobacter sp. S45]|jgi:DNA-binding transcriptional MerR regulator|uniref:MerR family transcriptional regulator n=1 Tax=Caulobacter sp. S45 TaxID=1641861 RepID=UPI00131A7876|nr:MerR family DNA-binding transcriptional regulator [Caulobacter sp. S45]
MTAAEVAEHAPTRLYTVTEMAEELGVTPRALRFYEDKGLITPSRAGTTRVYTRREHARMQLILRGKRLGFSLREIKQFLDLYDVDPTHKEQLRTLLEAVRHRIDDLETTREALTKTLLELREIEDQTLRTLAKRAPKATA